ncbi:hypothetical protein H4Q26_002621 [Puccinia striiformis f. sp. tritici PST-130]|nr:hypothetical protein H4Q26_002621 [Puccinia striiformis f. sp. tritici PST-130]
MLKIYDTVADFRMLFCDSTEFLEAWLDWSQIQKALNVKDNVEMGGEYYSRGVAAKCRIHERRNPFHTTLTSPTSVQGNTSALRVHLTELAELTIPLIKLARIFPDRFTKRTPKKLPFRLDTELNSEILSKLHYNPAWDISQTLDSTLAILTSPSSTVWRNEFRTSLQGSVFGVARCMASRCQQFHDYSWKLSRWTS